MRRSRLVGPALIVVSTVGWGTVLFSMVDRTETAVVLLVALLVGPAWAYAFCLASTDDDFPDEPWRDRDGWLRLLPWTFVLAPLVVPTVALLVQFFRDSRADDGRTWLGSGRTRPGEG